MTEDLSCIDGPDGCAGPVDWRTTPDRADGKAFARCEAHFEVRLDAAEGNMEHLSPCAPAWVDPAYAGEVWDDGDGWTGASAQDECWMNE